MNERAPLIFAAIAFGALVLLAALETASEIFGGCECECSTQHTTGEE